MTALLLLAAALARDPLSHSSAEVLEDPDYQT